MTIEELVSDDARGYEGSYRVAGQPPVAWWFDRPETEPDEDTEWSGVELPTGMALMVMVGDDRRWAIDPDDITRIGDDDYCGSCGQIGCGW